MSHPAVEAVPAVAPQPLPETHAAPAPAPTGGDGAAVVQALLRGLDLPDLLDRHPTLQPEQLAELAGRMLRDAVSGTIDVLQARNEIKRKVGVDYTIIGPQGNNPLKFSPGPEQALRQLLTDASRGYMRGELAVADAFDDLKAHQMATMAGMNAALAGVLQRFDPAHIESRLSTPSVMDKMLASNRKAKLWDLHVEQYRQMTGAADDDFQRLFGKSFSRAYDEQIDRLKNGPRQA